MDKLAPRDKWMSKWKMDISPRIRAFYWMARAEYAEIILKICFRNKKKNRAEHIRALEEKIKNQKEEITSMRETLEYRNKERKALNILVACDGPCNKPYMDDPDSVNEEMAKTVQRNYERFVHWYNRGGNNTYKIHLDDCKKRRLKRYENNPT